MRRARSIGLVLSALFGGACEPRERAALADMGTWTIAEGDDDAFAAEHPDPVVCDPSGVKLEDFGGEDALQVYTKSCPAVTVVQPTLADVRRGDEIYVRAWHDMLTGPGGAEANYAIALDGVELWRGSAPIPSNGGIILGRFEVSTSLDAGAELAWHVHNHGANSYHLFEVTLLPLGTEPEN